MKIKLTINHLIVITALLVFYQAYFLKFLYLLVIPGLSLIILFRKYSFNKALLFSVPLSLIFYIYPYFLLTRIGLSISFFLYALIPGLLLIYLLFENKFRFSVVKNFNLKKSLMLASVLIVFFMIYAPYSFRSKIPLTEGSNELRAIIDVNEAIINQGVVPHWSTELFGSNHYFYVGPPLTTLSTSFLSLIPTEPVYRTFNLSYSFMLAYLLLASYLLFKKLKLSDLGAVIGVLLVAGAPSIAGELTYAGNLTSSFMYAMMPVALYGFFSLFEDQKRIDLIIYSVALASFFLVYHFQFIFILYPALITVLVFLASSKRKQLFKNSLVYFGFAGLLILSWVVHLLFLTPSFEILGMEGEWNQALSSINEFIEFITYTGTSDVHKMTTSITPLFFYFGLISVFLCFRIKKGKLRITSQDLVMLVFSILVLFLIIVEVFPFHVYIPLRAKYYDSYRFWVTLIPLFAFGIGRLADNVLQYFEGYDLIILLGFIVLFLGVFTHSAGLVNEWLRESAIVSESDFEPIYNLIEPSNGRVAIYGLFGPGIIPAITRWTGASMFAGYNYERYSTKHYYNRLVLPITRAGMDLLYEDVSPVRVHNTYHKSWTNTVVFFSCTDMGLKAFNKTVQYPEYWIKVDHECLKVLLLNSSFAQKVVLSRVGEGLNRTQVISDLMTLPGAHSLVFTEQLLDLNYTNIIVDADLTNYVLEFKPLNWRRLSDTEIRVNSRPGYILIKEPYFPTWHAYQDGLELPVYQTYHGMILVESRSGSELKLLNLPHPVEWISLIIFLIVVVLFFVIRGFD